jgi:large subunit ribosomal protein L13
MLPDNRLSNEQINRLKVFVGAEHSHEAQQPKAYEIKE